MNARRQEKGDGHVMNKQHVNNPLFVERLHLPSTMARTRTTKKQSTQGTKKKIKALERQVNANEREVQQALRKSWFIISRMS
jgi:hypothetical protein